MTPALEPRRAFVAVRRSSISGGPRMDLESIGELEEIAQDNADREDDLMPSRGARDPVMRIARVEVREIGEVG